VVEIVVAEIAAVVAVVEIVAEAAVEIAAVVADVAKKIIAGKYPDLPGIIASISATGVN
jgi:hypothetical protein